MATKKPKGLGMGLEALLGPAGAALERTVARTEGTAGVPRPADAPASAREGLHTLAVGTLKAGRYQPRGAMEQEALERLADSIRQQGVVQPILVRPIAAEAGAAPGGPAYEIVAGERRFRAAQLAGLTEVPALVRPLNDQTAAVLGLVENMQRVDLNPLEEARGLKRLVDEFGLTHDEAAQAVSRSRSAATNLMRLLNLAQPVQQMLVNGALQMGHARALLSLDGGRQILLANEIVAKGLNVRQAEARAQQAQGARARGDGGTGDAKPSAAAKGPAPSRDLLRLQEALADALAAPVEIRALPPGKAGAQPGEITIRYGTLDELGGILQRLGVEL